jgi:hypothetical protein
MLQCAATRVFAEYGNEALFRAGGRMVNRAVFSGLRSGETAGFGGGSVGEMKMEYSNPSRYEMLQSGC